MPSKQGITRDTKRYEDQRSDEPTVLKIGVQQDGKALWTGPYRGHKKGPVFPQSPESQAGLGF